jgi:Ca2+-binding EF-hand superfamily protein
MRIRVGLAACLALALCVAAAWAQEERDGERRDGERRDGERRGDGERGDRDGRGGFQLPIIAALDKDRNGELNEEEIQGAVAALKTLDRNNDGKVARDEMMPQFGGGFGGFGGGRGGFGGPGGGFNSADFAEGMVRRMLEGDKNGDKMLTEDEVSERTRPRFSELDKNGDKKLDEAELKAMAEEISERFRQGGQGRGDGDRDGDRDGERRPRRPPAEDGNNAENPRL